MRTVDVMSINWWALGKLAPLTLLLALLGWAPVALAGQGRLLVASPQDPGSWDPVDTFLLNWASVATNIFDGLVYRGPDLKIVPALATSWETLDGGLRLRFHLRRNVRFQDGEPFNAAAVKFTFDRLLGEQGSKGPQRSNYASIQSVEVIDIDTVDLRLKAPDAVLLTNLAGFGAMMVPPRFIQEKGEDYFNAHPVGTGPFRLLSYTPKVGIKLGAFEQFWGGPPRLAELEYRFIPEPSTAIAELQAGRVDVVIPPTIPTGMIPVIEKDPSLELLSVPGPAVDSLRFNTARGITRDVRVRRALIMAVDRDAINKAILGGHAASISSFQSRRSFGDDPTLQPLPYDPAQAKRLLHEAGVKPGARVQIDVRGNDATFNEVAQAVASFLQVVGINAVLRPYDSNVFINDIVPAGRTGELFQQAWGGWTFDYDNTAVLMYHSGQMWNPYDKDARLDALLEAQRSMLDVHARERKLQEIARYVADRAWEMPLYNLNAIYAINRRVKNFVPAADNRLRLNEVWVE